MAIFFKISRYALNFYFLFTIVMKVLISCTENPKLCIKVLDELELFIDKKVIFDEIFFFGVPIILIGFWVEPANSVALPPYEFLAHLHF
jgi:hypothetical protein